jgi:L-amino acid N-acyltransferase YncA
MSARIRLARSSDAPAIAAIYGPVVESTAISFETEPPGAAEMARRIEQTMASHPWLVCEVGPGVVGYAYASPHRSRAAYRWSVDTSVYVAQRWHRRGIGRGLYTSLSEVLAAQGFINAYAGIALPNPASVRLHEAVGFTSVGVYERVGYKLGRWHDVGWWQRALTSPPAVPQEPRVLAAVREAAWLDESLARGVSAIHVTLD